MAYPYDDPEQLALANYLAMQKQAGQMDMTGRQASTMAGSMAPGAGIADAFGLYPAPNAGFNPSLRQNIGQGEYFDSLMQMLGAGGDLAMATGVGVPVGMTMKGAAATGKAGKAAKAAKKTAVFDPVKMRTQYPDTLPGVPAVDKNTGKPYIAKQNSPEALAVEKARKLTQKNIDKGNYTPMFNVESRYYADPSKYNIQGNTLTDAIPAKADTVSKYEAMYNTPEAKARLTEAFQKGSKDPMTKDWYAMGQLESEYIKRLGQKTGRQRFNEDFAQSMAATTGGADPTSNYLMGSFGNYQRARNLPIPKNAYDMPYPIGGRFASGNMKMYDKVLVQGNPMTAKDQPKRFNFGSNFLGDTSRATIDEQMMTGILPAMKAPAAGSYGVAENVVQQLASQLGVPGANAQDVMWAGLKNVPGKPMIQHVNESIERTARITGQTPEEVLNAMVLNRAPMYSAAPIGLMGLMGYDQYGQQGAD